MQGPGRADIVNAGCVGNVDIVNAGSRESGFSECRVRRRADIVNVLGSLVQIPTTGSGKSEYSECGVPGERI
ncbi:unnamed protein product [Staurois parvus]|uniref:Uncharacterized protein n=1 Tax=Staurois parvus TaxID=386267 RepID=A0ABN9D4A6_9NEOB|nr:unnamed protein product [Staurois parvus]